MAKKDTALVAEKHSDHPMVRIRLVGHFHMMSEPTCTASVGADLRSLRPNEVTPQASR